MKLKIKASSSKRKEGAAGEGKQIQRHLTPSETTTQHKHERARSGRPLEGPWMLEGLTSPMLKATSVSWKRFYWAEKKKEDLAIGAELKETNIWI